MPPLRGFGCSAIGFYKDAAPHGAWKKTSRPSRSDRMRVAVGGRGFTRSPDQTLRRCEVRRGCDGKFKSRGVAIVPASGFAMFQGWIRAGVEARPPIRFVASATADGAGTISSVATRRVGFAAPVPWVETPRLPSRPSLRERSSMKVLSFE